MKFSLLLSLGLICLTSACNKSDGEAKKNTIQVFFDLQGYMESQIEELQKEQPRVEKRIVLNGEEEGKTVEQLDYKKELQVFLKADINRPAWTDKYAIDSIIVNKQLTQLRYIAQDDDLKTRRLIITFEEGKVSSIDIDNYNTSAIANQDQKLSYDPLLGYTIHSKENVQLSDEQDLLVEVRFLRDLKW
ncbi:MAG: hypothetical protein DHS20C18_06360 [Saprospiraceae bacterium]|nr:MAG: hypothetical protein DHS20C18_06360 [Saprospiraceae bacterium]